MINSPRVSISIPEKIEKIINDDFLWLKKILGIKYKKHKIKKIWIVIDDICTAEKIKAGKNAYTLVKNNVPFIFKNSLIIIKNKYMESRLKKIWIIITELINEKKFPKTKFTTYRKKT